MPLETGSFINDLTQTNPTISDPAGQGDDHLRLIKTCLQGSLPQMGGIFGQVRSADSDATVDAIFNTSTYLVTNSATATVVLTMPANASITTGWTLNVVTRTGANAVITPASGSINGAATFAVPPFSLARIMYAGSNVWLAGRAGTGEGTETVDDLYVRGALSVSGAATLGTTLTVSGAATFKSAVSFGGAATLGTTLSVSGAAVFKAAVSIGGAVAMASTLSVSGAANFATTVTISGAAQLKSTLSVGGAATFAGNVTISGVVNISSGQIAFPLVQNASAGANVLDDYEEGSFTPTLTFATAGDLAVTYGARVGLYTKIGDMMMVTIRVATTAWTHSTANGALRITGLPAAALSVVGSTIGVQVAEFSGIAVTAGRTQVSGQIAAAATLLDFTTLDLSTGGAFNVTTAEAASGSAPTIILTITYKTST